VIDVRMRQDNRINVATIERHVAVAVKGFFAAALIQTAVQQNPPVPHSDQVHRAGHGSSRTPKLNMHRNSFLFLAAIIEQRSCVTAGQPIASLKKMPGSSGLAAPRPVREFSFA
jgi:hypothetical protein